ncbi:flagellar motor protein MotB [Halobacteriovorax sp.]|uniref:OmpA/MotB family protein n=1 Tax=Halobacteriovorax sp. TaxID=2020862 RepID=UPI00356B50AC
MYDEEDEDIDREEEEDDEIPVIRSVPPKSGGGGDDAGWLTSYADLMTLVACFFILMMAFANYDPATFQRKAEIMAKYFHGENDISDSKMKKLMVELNSISNMQNIIKVQQNNDGLDIVMNVRTFFNLGKATLTSDSQKFVDLIIDKIITTHKDVRVLVEGHTDNIPIHSRQFPSNWELSSARASTVTRRFETKGFNRKYLVAIGYADTKPAYPNNDKDGNPIEENQLRNRRIVLRVLHRPSKEVPMGLGVLFKANHVEEAPAIRAEQ